ncbi:MAG: hypothetical protein HY983_01660 [Candidatus Magasanikbacteria bacterium]|nr:hypothetical protein [Candidatus Magasanikbacteria bacterium]
MSERPPGGGEQNQTEIAAKAIPLFDFRHWVAELMTTGEWEKIRREIEWLEVKTGSFKNKPGAGSIEEMYKAMGVATTLVTGTLQYENVKHRELVKQLLGYFCVLDEFLFEYQKQHPVETK